jgi:hypothetical protein
MGKVVELVNLARRKVGGDVNGAFVVKQNWISVSARGTHPPSPRHDESRDTIHGGGEALGD